jgi:hypothetical protein
MRMPLSQAIAYQVKPIPRDLLVRLVCVPVTQSRLVSSDPYRQPRPCCHHTPKRKHKRKRITHAMPATGGLYCARFT